MLSSTRTALVSSVEFASDDASAATPVNSFWVDAGVMSLSGLDEPSTSPVLASATTTPTRDPSRLSLARPVTSRWISTLSGTGASSGSPSRSATGAGPSTAPGADGKGLGSARARPW